MDDSGGLIIGIILIAMFIFGGVLGYNIGKTEERERHCITKFEYALTAADTVAIVKEASFCVKLLEEE